MIDVCVSAKFEKTSCMKKKIHIWNPTTCSCENSKYVGRISGDSVITCEKIIEAKKTSLTKSISMKTVPTKAVLRESLFTNFCVLLASLKISVIDSC